MTGCPWGIDSGYFDVYHQWRPTLSETRQAILAAMGVKDGDAPPAKTPPVRVVYGGESIRSETPGRLDLEEGGTVEVRDSLPPDIPLGYHVFRRAGDEAPQRLIVAPRQCPIPSSPLWGWGVQLYAARSARSWGMGDLGDLHSLAQWSAGLGAGFLMLNPLLAQVPLLPQEPSPYYPTSRRFLNPLYLRIEDVPGAGQLGPELERLATMGRQLNAQRRIDRDAVFRVKYEALRAIWAHFTSDPAFEQFCLRAGQGLEQFATFCALAESLGSNWRRWPSMYHDPAGPAVARFAQDHAREVAFHKWLQWLLDEQLARAAKGLALVQDLPIGFDPNGADAWAWQSLLAADCTVGAPPDVFNTQGQDWQLPPFIPHKLRAAGYEPIVQTVRSALRHGGGLRIDHVMGLFRLFWIPRGFGPARGTYVRYRPEELLAIVALESHRAGAFVVGEDLGTVEMGVREQLAGRNVLSFRVLWFEERPPRDYPRSAMAAVTTHALPTIAGLWSGSDAEAQRRIGLPANRAMDELRARFARLVGAQAEQPIQEIVARTYGLLGEAPSLLLVATLEDALAIEERPNMPGTIDTWPNWSLALPGGLEALVAGDLARRIAQGLCRAPAKG